MSGKTILEFVKLDLYFFLKLITRKKISNKRKFKTVQDDCLYA